MAKKHSKENEEGFDCVLELYVELTAEVLQTSIGKVSDQCVTSVRCCVTVSLSVV